jgi:hypothetical protein
VLVVVVAALPLACEEEPSPDTASPHVAVGVELPGESGLWAGNPEGGPAILLAPVRKEGMDPRDACFRLGLEREPRAEANVYCAVKDRDGGVVELGASVLGPLTAVAGHAGAAVRKLLLEVAGRSVELPVSGDGAFLALLPASYRGNVALVARNGDGTVATRSFAAVRRQGAVFDGEIGKPVMDDRREELVRRFGPPAARRGSCWFYERVGAPGFRWKLCFEGRRVARAAGLWP